MPSDFEVEVRKFEARLERFLSRDKDLQVRSWS